MGKKNKQKDMTLPELVVALNRMAEAMDSKEQFAILQPKEGLTDAPRQGILAAVGMDGAHVISSQHLAAAVTLEGGRVQSVILIDTMPDQDGRFLVGVSVLCQAMAGITKDEAKEILYKLNLFGRAGFGGTRVLISKQYAGVAGAALSDQLAHLWFNLSRK